MEGGGDKKYKRGSEKGKRGRDMKRYEEKKDERGSKRRMRRGNEGRRNIRRG